MLLRCRDVMGQGQSLGFRVFVCRVLMVLGCVEVLNCSVKALCSGVWGLGLVLRCMLACLGLLDFRV